MCKVKVKVRQTRKLEIRLQVKVIWAGQTCAWKRTNIVGNFFPTHLI